jgi:hypothetical protein
MAVTSALGAGQQTFTPQKHFLVLISIRGWTDPNWNEYEKIRVNSAPNWNEYEKIGAELTPGP